MVLEEIALCTVLYHGHEQVAGGGGMATCKYKDDPVLPEQQWQGQQP